MTTNSEIFDQRMVDERFAPDITIDRGQPVIVTIDLCGEDPDLAYFSFMKPGDPKPYTDDGYGQPKSKIERLDIGVYRYTISTHGFNAGDGTWHFTGEWKTTTVRRPYDEASIFGRYHVNKAPAQLL